ncbi:fibronectin type III domain-containing protein [Fibrella forsythiae]|uniref:Fibronectin type III domain-containing protein n=1 Tax=Fibrella forsythiae TaxID=2817061 RepID=A0ABS3JNW6_9BACT|nr:fibronectin type III domain-containing protein [Fibrella forsythiae]MBO0951675.1 fibronectin type III domain-containing protein [Fibrella forsythiae]
MYYESNGQGYGSVGNLTPDTDYEWYIVTTCPYSGSSGYGEEKTYSQVSSFTTVCAMATDLEVLTTSSTEALVSWEGSYEEVYTVRWRPVGSTTWTTRRSPARPYSILGLKDATAYEWQVQTVCDANYNSNFTQSATFTTGCNVPAVTKEYEIGATFASLFWQQIEGETRYQLSWQQEGEPTSQTAIIEGNRSFEYGSVYSPTGLSASSVYTWKVRAICPDGSVSSFSEPRSFTTYACSPPSGLNEEATSSLSENFTWSGNRKEAYRVQLRPKGTMSWVDYIPDSYNYLSVIGLLVSTPYEWRVALTCSASQTVVSETRSFTTAACQVPTGLAEYGVEPTAAGLDWDAIGYGQYTVQYKLATATAWLAKPVTTDETYVLDGLVGGTVYDWRIQNTCPGGVATVSVVRSFTTQCAAPLSAVVRGVSATAAFVGWTTVTTGQYQQRVRWRKSGGDTWTYGVPTTAAVYSITGLTTDTAYEWQVQSICDGQETEYQRQLPFTTKCLEPGWINTRVLSPSKVRVTMYNIPAGTQFDLVWRDQTSSTSTSVTTAPTPEGGRFEYDITGLLPDKTYQLQVRIQCIGITSTKVMTQSFVILPPVDYSLSMAVSNRTPKVGDLVTYALTVRNAGTDSTYIRVVDRLPPGISYVSTPDKYYVFHSAEQVYVDMGVAPGKLSTVRFLARVNKAGTFINAAEIEEASSRPDPDSEPGTGYADGEDDAAQVDIRTADQAGPVYYSPNPNQRVLPPVVPNQPTVDPDKADISLQMSVNTRTPKDGESVTLMLTHTNRGGARAPGIIPKLLLPAGWEVRTPIWTATGLPNEYRLTIPMDLLPDTSVSLPIPVRVSGKGPQQIKAQIAESNVPDPDSTPNNGYTNGEDDTVTIDVRL